VFAGADRAISAPLIRSAAIDPWYSSLDLGPGAGLAECVEVAFAIRERLGSLGQWVVRASCGYLGVNRAAAGLCEVMK
jgi:hypothetical protein